MGVAKEKREGGGEEINDTKETVNRIIKPQ